MVNLRVAGVADEFLRSRRSDCMIRTCPRLGSLTVVDRLARGHGVPWSTDLRDVPDEYDSERTKWLFRQAARFVSRTCSSVVHILTVSDPLARELSNE